MRRFFVQNFGCRATQADGAALESLLAAKGLESVPARADADLVVLNTCTVTSSADDEVRQTLRRVHRENPEARILVTGCYAQRAPEELAALPGVEWVVGNSHKTQIAELVTSAPYHGKIHVGDIFAAARFSVRAGGGRRRRPHAPESQDPGRLQQSLLVLHHSVRARAQPQRAGRRRWWSRCAAWRASIARWCSAASTWDAGAASRAAGCAWPIWCGVLLAETGVERLRLSSVEPMDFSDDLLGLMAASPRIAKHVHAPLQSGSDRVLRRMHRKYRPRHYADRIHKARALMPDAAIGADVMVGFPGETEAEFEESRAFIASLPFTYLHVFTYSERPGTPAAEVGGPGADACAQGAQPRSARTGRGEEPGVPPPHGRQAALRGDAARAGRRR